ncbi:hypothetical protein JOM56_002817 [Amanita muscaria]
MSRVITQNHSGSLRVTQGHQGSLKIMRDHDDHDVSFTFTRYHRGLLFFLAILVQVYGFVRYGPPYLWDIDGRRRGGQQETVFDHDGEKEGTHYRQIDEASSPVYEDPSVYAQLAKRIESSIHAPARLPLTQHHRRAEFHNSLPHSHSCSPSTSFVLWDAPFKCHFSSIVLSHSVGWQKSAEASSPKSVARDGNLLKATDTSASRRLAGLRYLSPSDINVERAAISVSAHRENSWLSRCTEREPAIAAAVANAVQKTKAQF